MPSVRVILLLLCASFVATCARFDAEGLYLGLLLTGSGGGGGSSASGGSLRRTLTFDNSAQATTLSTFPILVTLNSSRIDYASTQDAGQDLYFTDSSGNPLSQEIELWNEAGTSHVWVNVTSISASSSSDFIYMYYGNASASDSQNATGTWNTNYQGVWHLNSALTDSTSSANNGTNNGSTDTTGYIQNGRNFDGISRYFTVGTDLNTWLGGTFSFSVWLRTTQTGHATYWQAPGITGIEDSGGTDDIFVGWLSNTGTLNIQAGNTAGAASAVINDGTWRHFTFTRDSASGTVNVYTNGAFTATATSDTGTKTNSFFDFGRVTDTGGTPTFLGGDLDKIRILNSVMSADWIAAQYLSQTDAFIAYGSEESI